MQETKRIWSTIQLDDPNNVMWIHTIHVDANGDPLAPVKIVAIEDRAAECELSFREACYCALHQSRTDPEHATLWTIQGNAAIIPVVVTDGKPRVISQLARRGSPLASVQVPDGGEVDRVDPRLVELALNRIGTTQTVLMAYLPPDVAKAARLIVNPV